MENETQRGHWDSQLTIVDTMKNTYNESVLLYKVQYVCERVGECVCYQ